MAQRHIRFLQTMMVVGACVMAGASAGVASARESVDPSTLNPPPPDLFNAVCLTQGSQIVCDLAFSDPPVSDEPSGIVCDGTELLVSQTRDVVGKRFYDASGDLLRRHFREDFTGSFTNPETRAYGSDGLPEVVLYQVAFELEQARTYVDVYEHWLEEVR